MRDDRGFIAKKPSAPWGLVGRLAAIFRLWQPRTPTADEFRRAAADSPCEPTRTSDWPPDPYAGIVNGPELVERTRWTHAQHRARYLEVDDEPT